MKLDMKKINNFDLIKNDFELLKEHILVEETENLKKLEQKSNLYFKRIVFGFIS